MSAANQILWILNTCLLWSGICVVCLESLSVKECDLVSDTNKVSNVKRNYLGRNVGKDTAWLICFGNSVFQYILYRHSKRKRAAGIWLNSSWDSGRKHFPQYSTVCYFKSGDQQGEIFRFVLLSLYGRFLLRVQTSQARKCNFQVCLNLKKKKKKKKTVKRETAVEEGDKSKLSPKYSYIYYTKTISYRIYFKQFVFRKLSLYQLN